MIRNIPNVLTQRDLLRLIDSKGFFLKYNFFYLPIDFSSKANCGYAFLNFHEAPTVPNFMREFTGITLHEKSSKLTVCCLARLQGFHANVAYYR